MDAKWNGPLAEITKYLMLEKLHLNFKLPKSFSNTHIYLTKYPDHGDTSKISYDIREKLRLIYPTHSQSFEALYASISHTKKIGGFVLAPFPVGFDLEHEERVLSTKAFERLGKKEELTHFKKSPLELWVAKEACFKSLEGPQQPETLSQISIVFKKKEASKNLKHYGFKVSDSSQIAARGDVIVLKVQRLIMGIARLLA